MHGGLAGLVCTGFGWDVGLSDGSGRALGKLGGCGAGVYTAHDDGCDVREMEA